MLRLPQGCRREVTLEPEECLMQITAADPVAQAETFLAGTGFATFEKANVDDAHPSVLKAYRNGACESVASGSLSRSDGDAMFAMVISRNEHLHALSEGCVEPERVDMKSSAAAPLSDEQADALVDYFHALQRDMGIDIACEQCRKHDGPAHYGSARCRSGSIAAGGRRAHCSCGACY
jgi:hypothetical protein